MSNIGKGGGGIPAQNAAKAAELASNAMQGKEGTKSGSLKLKDGGKISVSGGPGLLGKAKKALGKLVAQGGQKLGTQTNMAKAYKEDVTNFISKNLQHTFGEMAGDLSTKSAESIPQKQIQSAVTQALNKNPELLMKMQTLGSITQEDIQGLMEVATKSVLSSKMETINDQIALNVKISVKSQLNYTENGINQFNTYGKAINKGVTEKALATASQLIEQNPEQYGHLLLAEASSEDIDAFVQDCILDAAADLCAERLMKNSEEVKNTVSNYKYSKETSGAGEKALKGLNNIIKNNSREGAKKMIKAQLMRTPQNPVRMTLDILTTRTEDVGNKLSSHATAFTASSSKQAAPQQTVLFQNEAKHAMSLLGDNPTAKSIDLAAQKEAFLSKHSDMDLDKIDSLIESCKADKAQLKVELAEAQKEEATSDQWNWMADSIKEEDNNIERLTAIKTEAEKLGLSGKIDSDSELHTNNANTLRTISRMATMLDAAGVPNNQIMPQIEKHLAQAVTTSHEQAVENRGATKDLSDGVGFAESTGELLAAFSAASKLIEYVIEHEPESLVAAPAQPKPEAALDKLASNGPPTIPTLDLSKVAARTFDLGSQDYREKMIDTLQEFADMPEDKLKLQKGKALTLLNGMASRLENALNVHPQAKAYVSSAIQNLENPTAAANIVVHNLNGAITELKASLPSPAVTTEVKAQGKKLGNPLKRAREFITEKFPKRQKTETKTLPERSAKPAKLAPGAARINAFADLAADQYIETYATVLPKDDQGQVRADVKETLVTNMTKFAKAHKMNTKILVGLAKPSDLVDSYFLSLNEINANVATEATKGLPSSSHLGIDFAGSDAVRDMGRCLRPLGEDDLGAMREAYTQFVAETKAKITSNNTWQGNMDRGLNAIKDMPNADLLGEAFLLSKDYLALNTTAKELTDADTNNLQMAYRSFHTGVYAAANMMKNEADYVSSLSPGLEQIPQDQMKAAVTENISVLSHTEVEQTPEQIIAQQTNMLAASGANAIAKKLGVSPEAAGVAIRSFIEANVDSNEELRKGLTDLTLTGQQFAAQYGNQL